MAERAEAAPERQVLLTGQQGQATAKQADEEMAVAVRDIGLMYLAKLEQRSSGEVSIERDVIGFGEPDEPEE